MAEAKQGSWIGRVVTSVRQRRKDRETAAELYGAIVERARDPALYLQHGIPDTTDGRLEAIGLFAALVMRRLRDAGERGEALAQALFDLMFDDIDRSLREQGVGDLSVGKHVKRAASTFLARSRTIDQTLASGDDEGLGEAIARNLRVDRSMATLTGVLFDYQRELSAHPLDEITAGRLPQKSQRD